MKEFLNNAILATKAICSWLFTLLIISSLLLNFWLAGQVQIHNDLLKDHSNYIKYRDSLQLEQLDRNSDRLGIRK